MSKLIALEGKRMLRQSQVEKLQEQGVAYMSAVLTEPNLYTIKVYNQVVCNVPSERFEEIETIIKNTLIAAGVIAVE